MRATALGLDFTSSERKVLGEASDSFHLNPIPGKSIAPMNDTPFTAQADQFGSAAFLLAILHHRNQKFHGRSKRDSAGQTFDVLFDIHPTRPAQFLNADLLPWNCI